MLKLLEGQQLFLGIATAVFALFRWIINLAKDIPEALETIIAPNGQTIQKATVSGFDKELQDAAEERRNEAKKYFDAGEKDFKANNYSSAANNYRASIDRLPTMSACLNAGTSFYNSSDYQGAERAYQEGLKLAQQKGDKSFEAAFLGNIGNVYYGKGKLDDALNYHQQALALFKTIGNPLGQANALGNIGLVYADKGKLDDALDYYQQARILFQKIGATMQLRQVEANINKIKLGQQI